MTKLLLSVLFFSLSSMIFPQVTLSSLYERYYDDNIFNNASKVSDFINSLSLGTGYNIQSDNNNIQFYYMNNLNYFQQNIYKSSVTHKLGVVDTYLFSDDENPLNIGINYSFKQNRDYFVLFDFNILSIYSNYFHRLGPDSRLLAGYLFLRNRFDNYPMFSHDENKIFLKYNVSFETKTSLIAGIEYDYKNYLKSSIDYAGSQSISQTKFYLNFAQSVGELTGLNAHFLIRKNLTSGTRFLTSGEYIYYEEEIFTDNYSNDGYEIGAGLTHHFSSVFKGSFGITYQTNKYLNLPVVDENGYETDALRSDKRVFTFFEIDAELNKFINGLYASFSLGYITNSSNDIFYKYNNSVYSVGLGWEF